MQDDIESKRNFHNRREWGSYLGDLQSTAAYPKVLDAVKSGRNWFSQSAAQASSWLSGTARLRGQLKYGQA